MLGCKSDPILSADPAQNLEEALLVRIADFNLVPNTPKERFISELLRRNVGGKDQEHFEGDFDCFATEKREMIDPRFHRHDPAIKQFLRLDKLAPKVIDTQDPAIGFYLQWRKVEARLG